MQIQINQFILNILMHKVVPSEMQGKNQDKNKPGPKQKKFQAQQFDEKAIFLCQFCGGEKCPQQDYLTNKIQPNAITGLHSNWITHNILAMQRPSSRLIKQFDIYEKFKKEKINTILNLQEPGEHPYCGDGINPLIGFSYDPEGFFKHGISFFNESWEDMTATTFQHMMGIMNIFHRSLEHNGKISVHCHAGRGRTLLVICSWLIFNDRFSAQKTIELAVERRQGVLTKSSQRQFLVEFQKQLQSRRTCFGNTFGNRFNDFVEHEKISLLRHQQKKLSGKPYVHHYIFDELKKRMNESQPNAKKLCLQFLGSNQKWTQNQEKILSQLKAKANSHTLLSECEKIQSIDSRILVELIYDFYEGLPYTLLNLHLIEKLTNLSKTNPTKLGCLLEPDVIHETGIYALIVLVDLVQFLKELTHLSLNLLVEGEQTDKCDCLFLRISMMLLGKKKYFSKLFSSQGRDCKLLSYSKQKRAKYLNEDVIFLANFMRSLTKQVGEETMEKLIVKLKNVEVNLYREGQGNEQFLQKEKAQKIFNKARIVHDL